jgi:SAM-dependent methyltransferase
LPFRQAETDTAPVRGHDVGMTHSHDQHTGRQPDWGVRGPDLIADGEVNAPMVNEALAWLAGRVPKAELVVDVGSGPGVAACTLAQLLPDAQVLAVDGTPELLELAAERAARLGLDRFGTRGVTLPDGLAELPSADLIWASGVVHHLEDPAAAVRDLAGRLRPGGVLALREGGLPLRWLPSYADRGLSARIDAINAELSAGHAHPMGAMEPARAWPELLRDAGLEPVSRTFLLDLPAPLGESARTGLWRNLRMTREMIGEQLTAEDAALLDRLTDDHDPEGVLHRPDVFLLRASTIHTGVRL